jgi:DNA mismatch endonuclease (patch repair protein)
MDPFDAAKRSEIMSHIRGKDTDVEKKVRSLLHSLGYRFRLHVDGLPGKPDIVLPKYASIVFVHGCFWHGHNRCKRASIPQTNREFWTQKISGNMQRDRRTIRELHKLGWKVLVVWQCQTKNRALVENRIAKFLGKDED